VRLRPAGEKAVLVELGSLEEVHRLHRAVLSAGFAVDSVPGWSTLLVTTDGDVRSLRDGLAALTTSEPVPTRPRRHELPTRYDGPDLDDVATACGLAVEEVVALHSSVDYVVAFLGFSRGFPYLAGLPEHLHLPRRATPRTRVPSGSVAIAHDQCGIYPSASPGGWHLLGTTDAVLFDPALDPPSPFAPGDLVRFVPTP
jgi:KipI family sensor histidine kinase inhibitor